MIPRTLQAALAGDELPPWLREANPARNGAAAALDRRAVLHFRRLLDSRRARLRDVLVLDRPWPETLDPATVAWPRESRVLCGSGIAATPAALSELTYGRLLAVRGAGPRAVFAFAAAAEQRVDQAYADALPAELGRLQRRAAHIPWHDAVSGEDPRFRGLLPAGAGALSEASPWRLPEIFERAAQIERLPLEAALRDYLAALTGVEDERLDPLLARLGLDGRPPRSLPQAVDGSRISCERVRQLQLRALERRPSHPVYLPALERALAQLAAMAPCAVTHAARALQRSGIASLPFHPASVLSAARLCGATTAVELMPSPGGGLVVTSSLRESASKLVRLARHRAGRFGGASVAALVAAAREQGLDVCEAELRTLLVELEGARFVADDWFWLPREARNRLDTLTRRILAVSSPCALATVRAGVCRAYPRMQAVFVPPLDVLGELYRAHPSFDLDLRGRVVSIGESEWGRSLGKNDRIFVDAFRASWTGVLDGPSFRAACAARGMSSHTFAFCSAYSVVLDHPEPQLWCLRGTLAGAAAAVPSRATEARHSVRAS